MAATWEYCSLAIRVTQRRERGAFFSHHGRQHVMGDESDEQLTALGKEGWEMVSAFATDQDGNAIAIFKRPC